MNGLFDTVQCQIVLTLWFLLYLFCRTPLAFIVFGLYVFGLYCLWLILSLCRHWMVSCLDQPTCFKHRVKMPCIKLLLDDSCKHTVLWYNQLSTPPPPLKCRHILSFQNWLLRRLDVIFKWCVDLVFRLTGADLYRWPLDCCGQHLDAFDGYLFVDFTGEDLKWPLQLLHTHGHTAQLLPFTRYSNLPLSVWLPAKLTSARFV